MLTEAYSQLPTIIKLYELQTKCLDKYYEQVNEMLDNDDVNVFLFPIVEDSDVLPEMDFYLSRGISLLPIGNWGGEDLPICVDICSGEIIIFDEEKNEKRHLLNSLTELFMNLSPRHSDFM